MCERLSTSCLAEPRTFTCARVDVYVCMCVCLIQDAIHILHSERQLLIPRRPPRLAPNTPAPSPSHTSRHPPHSATPSQFASLQPQLALNRSSQSHTALTDLP